MIIIPFHMNPRAVNPILVTVFPKKRRRTKHSDNKGNFLEFIHLSDLMS